MMGEVDTALLLVAHQARPTLKFAKFREDAIFIQV